MCDAEVRGTAGETYRKGGDEEKTEAVTEISLDATEMGKHLYEALGFKKNCAGMVLELR